jgi:hypothetical protein
MTPPKTPPKGRPGGTSAYLDHLTQLIPSEFIAAYLAIYNAIINANISEDYLISSYLTISGIILLLILPFYIYFIKKVNSVVNIVCSCISLVIWVISIGKILEWTSWYKPVFATIFIIIWTLVSPLLVAEK